MRRTRLTIDHLILKGIDAGAQKALVDGLQQELSRAMADSTAAGKWTQPGRTPAIRLGQMPIKAGPAGGREFGTRLGNAIGKRLKP